MYNTKKVIDYFVDKLKVVEFVGVPCSYLKNLINEATNRGMYKSFFNEGDAVAYAVGRQIADPDIRVCVMMQNSGLGNAVNPITSLSEINEIPLIMVVGNRQPTPGEPQHSIMGEISKELVYMVMMETGGATIDLNKEELKENEVENPDGDELPYIPDEYLDESIVYFVNDKNVFTKVDLINPVESKGELTYEDVIDALTYLRESQDFILVTTTGYTSRVAYMKDHNLNFYNVGAMGCAWSIANGLSKNKAGLPVICLDGDGAMLMRASSTYSFDSQSGVIRIILRNGTYRSTGGQSLYDEGNKTYSVEPGTFPRGLSVIETKEDLWFFVNYLKDRGLFNEIRYVDIFINDKVPSELPRPKESQVELRQRLSDEISKYTEK